MNESSLYIPVARESPSSCRAVGRRGWRTARRRGDGGIRPGSAPPRSAADPTASSRRRARLSHEAARRIAHRNARPACRLRSRATASASSEGSRNLSTSPPCRHRRRPRRRPISPRGFPSRRSGPCSRTDRLRLLRGTEASDEPSEAPRRPRLPSGRPPAQTLAVTPPKRSLRTQPRAVWRHRTSSGLSSSLVSGIRARMLMFPLFARSFGAG